MKWVAIDPLEAGRRAYHAYHKQGGPDDMSQTKGNMNHQQGHMDCLMGNGDHDTICAII